MKTVNIIKNLRMVVIALVGLLCCIASIQKSHAVENVNNSLYVVNEYYNNNSDHVIEYNDESYAVVNTSTNTYEFTPYQLGDWNYTCNSINELNNLIASYNLCKNEYDNYSNIYIVNSYVKNDGSIVTEYNDKSWTVQNDKLGLYEFYTAITEDYTIQFDSADQMNNCVATYISIKENGYY